MWRAYNAWREATREGIASVALEIPAFWNSGVITKDNGSYDMKQFWTYGTSCVYYGGQNKKNVELCKHFETQKILSSKCQRLSYLPF